jgi:hypothetical protein
MASHLAVRPASGQYDFALTSRLGDSKRHASDFIAILETCPGLAKFAMTKKEQHHV